MLLQTNSYVVPRDRRVEHARLMRQFKQTLLRIGCDQFDVYEQVGPQWGSGQATGRFVQVMRFRDRRHQLAVQAAERQDVGAQATIAEFCELINFEYQQQQGFFASSFYQSVLPVAESHTISRPAGEQPENASDNVPVTELEVEPRGSATENLNQPVNAGESTDTANSADDDLEVFIDEAPASPSADAADDNAQKQGSSRSRRRRK